jgi:hypothetical protein
MAGATSLRWGNIDGQLFHNMGEGIDEALKLHELDIAMRCGYVNPIREMLIDEITWEMNCDTILAKLQEFLKMAENVTKNMTVLDIDILRDILAAVIQWTETRE